MARAEWKQWGLLESITILGMGEVGRPIQLAEGQPIAELLS